MIKKNFPRDWHSNIMTIHRCLGFAPEFYEEPDMDGDIVSKMRFTPTYNAYLQLPWDVIIIDEAGMVSLDLWRQLWAAAKPTCRIIMIGDINQLPPVHGRSIFGFALSAWPSFELTHIHRQVGVNNSIVDGAWEIIRGFKPKSDLPAHLSLGDSTNSEKSKLAVLETLSHLKSRDGWKLAMVKVPEDADVASQRIRKVMQLLNGKSYDPIRDSIVTAINGDKGTERGLNLGQIPLNRELAIVLNKTTQRFIIDGGRERKQFAVGDKVMATKNDYEAGITNGMTGIIVDISRNAGYAGESGRFGLVQEVQDWLNDQGLDEDEEEFGLEALEDIAEAQSEGAAASKEGRDRGPASHIVTVQFGEGDHAFELPFGSLSEVASLMTAYAVTCHKMQGGESPLVIGIMHQAHKAMMYREWAYTMVTRASQNCIVFYTDLGLRVALNKQKIMGKTLAEKIRVFQKLTEDSVMGKAVNVTLPDPVNLNTGLITAPKSWTPTLSQKTALIAQEKLAKMFTPQPKPESAAKPTLAEMLKRAAARGAKIHIHLHEKPVDAQREEPAPLPADIDGGVIQKAPLPALDGPGGEMAYRNHKMLERVKQLKLTGPEPMLMLPAPKVDKPQFRFGGLAK
jgi:hypothetical protein